MDANLEGPLKRLSEALQKAISESPDVESSLLDVRAEGFHAFLVLEVTIGLSRLSPDDDGEPPRIEILAGDDAEAGASPRFSSRDLDFLKKLRIRLDD